ncbi:MAG: hypothetical protein OXU61_06065 [Gammaproteobacteria bacterium]|nr:hypothetical protein [Gammaproteobacteria bacterium]
MTSFSQVFIAEAKLTNYLLDLESEDGKAKARFFISTCGFSPDNPRALEDELRKHPLTAEPKGTRQTDDGGNYAFICDIQTPNRGPTCIVSVWRIDQQSGRPHLVSARPLHKRESRARGE